PWKRGSRTILRTVARFVSLSFFSRLKASQLPARRWRRTLVILPPASHREIVIRLLGRIGDAGHRVCQIVVTMRSVIDRILAGTRDPAVEADDLTDQAIVLRQQDASRIQ